MTTQEKADEIKNWVHILLDGSYVDITRKINIAIHSGALDIDGWDPDKNAMLLPKIITMALLEDAIGAYTTYGIYFDKKTEKQVKKEVKNLKLFL